jgi:hypothetical protein
MKKLYVTVILTALILVGLTEAGGQNMALALDGIDDYVEVFDSPSLDLTGPLTLCMWYCFSELPGPEFGLVLKDGPDSYGRYGLWLFETDGLIFCLYPVTVPRKCISPDYHLSDGMWAHIAGVYDGGTMEIFVNGESIGSDDMTGVISASDLSLFIGADVSEPTFAKGAIDEVSIWNVALTQSQIQQIMSQPLPPAYYNTADSGVVAYYNFDQFEDLNVRNDGADDFRDFSVFHNHGDSEGSPSLILSGWAGLNERAGQNIKSLSAFPNPVSGELKVDYYLEKTSDVAIGMYDIYGRFVAALYRGLQTPGGHQLTWDTGSLPQGIYACMLTSGNTVKTIRVVVQK